MTEQRELFDKKREENLDLNRQHRRDTDTKIEVLSDKNNKSFLNFDKYNKAQDNLVAEMKKEIYATFDNEEAAFELLKKQTLEIIHQHGKEAHEADEGRKIAYQEDRDKYQAGLDARFEALKESTTAAEKATGEKIAAFEAEVKETFEKKDAEKEASNKQIYDTLDEKFKALDGNLETKFKDIDEAGAALKTEMTETFEKKDAEKAESDTQKQEALDAKFKALDENLDKNFSGLEEKIKVLDAKLEASAKVIESLVAMFEKFHKNAAISAIISDGTADELAAIRSTHEALKTTLVPPA